MADDKNNAVILRSDTPLANLSEPKDPGVFQLVQDVRIQEVIQNLKGKHVLCTADEYCAEVDSAALQQLADNHEALLGATGLKADLLLEPAAFDQKELKKNRLIQVAQSADGKDSYVGYYPLNLHSVREVTAGDAHELGHIAAGDYQVDLVLNGLADAGLIPQEAVNTIEQAQETRADAYATCLVPAADLENYLISTPGDPRDPTHPFIGARLQAMDAFDKAPDKPAKCEALLRPRDIKGR